MSSQNQTVDRLSAFTRMVSGMFADDPTCPSVITSWLPETEEYYASVRRYKQPYAVDGWVIAKATGETMSAVLDELEDKVADLVPIGVGDIVYAIAADRYSVLPLLVVGVGAKMIVVHCAAEGTTASIAPYSLFRTLGRAEKTLSRTEEPPTRAKTKTKAKVKAEAEADGAIAIGQTVFMVAAWRDKPAAAHGHRPWTMSIAERLVSNVFDNGRVVELVATYGAHKVRVFSYRVNLTSQQASATVAYWMTRPDEVFKDADENGYLSAPLPHLGRS